MRRRCSLRFGVAATALLTGLVHAATALAQTSVTIEINNTVAATDDYITWSVVPVRARLLGSTTNLNVSLRSSPNVKLLAATSDGQLWMRDSVLRDIVWQPIGQNNGVVAMTGLGGRLFGVSRDGKLWARDAAPAGAPWQEIGAAPNVVAIAALGLKIFATTSDNKLLVRDAVIRNASFQEIGDANNVIAMAATGGKLFAATRDNKLWARDPILQNVAWQEIGHANDVVGMTASGGRLFASMRDNKLWAREDVLRDMPWTTIGPADNVVAMAASTEGGAIAFLPDPQGAAVPASSIDVTLRGDGAWKSFFIVGRRPSTEDKDTAIVATTTTNRELGRVPLMVRVRKNAETLTESERDRFLRAFVRAAARNNQFAKYWGVHTDAINLAHQAAFLPWHRVFLIQLERELQVEDPSVALPYWEFDKPAPNLFSEDFLGRVDPTAADRTLVRFTSSNPLSTWSLSDPAVTPLRRNRNGDTSVSPALNKNYMRIDQHQPMAVAIFGPYHGSAHAFIGGIIGDFGRSPADPLFFLLHASVDRAWAVWQRFYDRFNRSQAANYAPQGIHTGSASLPLGNFVDDTMWPWDGITRPTEPVMLTTAPVLLPPNPGPGSGLIGHPQVGDALDYLDLLNLGRAQGFCYDSVPRGVGPVAPFWP